MSEFMSRDELLAPCGRRYEIVNLPNGRKVRVRSLTERERGKWEADSVMRGGTGVKRERLEDAKLRLLVLTVVDEQGNPILLRSDVEVLFEQDAAVVALIYGAAVKVNDISDGDLEDLVGNSETTGG